MVQRESEWPEVRLRQLGPEECWQLISSDPERRVARVAWTTASGPVILPVNYTVHEHEVWMRTSASSALAREVDDTQVAFETDEVDPATHLGWSVVVRGTAEVMYHHEQIPDAVRSEHPWPTGARPLWIRVRGNDLSGRRLAAAGVSG